MRHLGSLLAGILIAPIAWGLIALGQRKSSATVSSWLASDSFDTKDLLQPAAFLLAAGILIGLVATLRISPLGALVAGVLYAGTYLGLLINPFRVRDAVPGSITLLDQRITPRTPLDNGTLLLVGTALLIAVFSAARWRGRVVPVAAPAEVAPAEPVSPGAPGEGLGEAYPEGYRPEGYRPEGYRPEPSEADQDRTVVQPGTAEEPTQAAGWTGLPGPRHAADNSDATAAGGLTPPASYPQTGYPQQQGYPATGQPESGYPPPQTYPPQTYPQQPYQQPGYPQQPYQQPAQPSGGYPPAGTYPQSPAAPSSPTGQPPAAPPETTRSAAPSSPAPSSPAPTSPAQSSPAPSWPPTQPGASAETFRGTAAPTGPPPTTSSVAEDSRSEEFPPDREQQPPPPPPPAPPGSSPWSAPPPRTGQG